MHTIIGITLPDSVSKVCISYILWYRQPAIGGPCGEALGGEALGGGELGGGALGGGALGGGALESVACTF